MFLRNTYKLLHSQKIFDELSAVFSRGMYELLRYGTSVFLIHLPRDFTGCMISIAIIRDDFDLDGKPCLHGMHTNCKRNFCIFPYFHEMHTNCHAVCASLAADDQSRVFTGYIRITTEQFHLPTM